MPKYWLRAFAEDGHVLGRWRTGAEHRTPVRRAAVARDFNTDPLAKGEQRVALETYLDHHVDGPCAPVLRAVREGRWPLDRAQHALVLDALAWQVVRTQAFRSFDEQVGRQLFPALWASEAVGFCEEQLGRPLSDAERMDVFWTAVRTAPGPCVVADSRSALRSMIRASARTRDLLTVPGRRLVVLRSAEPLLTLGDSGVPCAARTAATARIKGSRAGSLPRPTRGQQPGARTPSTGSHPCPGPPGCSFPAPRWRSGRRG